jgi:hypothetical protein
MSRLVVFGCSYAYGYALPDCNTDIDSAKPSKFSWPTILAKTIEKKLINKSYPASSIKRIWYTINNFKFKPDDVVIISWSYAHRYSIIKHPWNIKNLINTATDDAESMAYYEHNYSWYDSYVMSKLFVDDANRILKENNIKVYNLFLNFSWELLLKKHHNVIPLHIENYLKKYPLALDDAHLGLEGNQAFAEDLLKYLV